MALGSEGGKLTLSWPLLWLIVCLADSTLWHLVSEPALGSELGSPVDTEHWSLSALQKGPWSFVNFSAAESASLHQPLPAIQGPLGHYLGHGPSGLPVSPSLAVKLRFLQPISNPQSPLPQKMAPPLSAPRHFFESPSFTPTSKPKCCQSYVQTTLRTHHFCPPTLLRTPPSPQTTVTASLRGYPLPSAQHHLSHSIYGSQNDYFKRQLTPLPETLNGFLQHKDWTASPCSSPRWSALTSVSHNPECTFSHFF